MLLRTIQSKSRLGIGFAFSIRKEKMLSKKKATGVSRMKTFMGEE
jgi:hypothetical protein